MTDTTDTGGVQPDIPAFENGALRLFALDTGERAARTLIDAIETGGPPGDRALAGALGVPWAEARWTTLVARRDLGAMGLDDYLHQGFDIPRDQLDAAGDRLDTPGTHLLAVPSPAFGGRAGRLEPAGWLTPVAQFSYAETPEPARPMAPAAREEPAAEPADDTGSPAKEEAAPRRWLVLAILVGAAILVAALALF